MVPDLYQAPYSALSEYGRRLLAEGDSWFTIGSLTFERAPNLLGQIELATSTAIVSCAYPGDTLQRMVDGVHDAWFDRLLRVRRYASYWDAILFSAGGNDLIDACQVPARDATGQPIPPTRRLLLTPDEAPPGPPARYLSEPGWTLLADYLRANLSLIVQRRDQGPSAGRPLFLHTYAVPTARPAGAPGAPLGWLYPALLGMGIPEADWPALTAELFGRLRALLLAADAASGSPHALADVHVFDSAGMTTIVPAQPGTRGDSGDWVNEIHLNTSGYVKVGRAFGAFIDATLAAYP